jgi:hypothetical protein
MAPEDFDAKVRALRNAGRPPQDVLQEPPVLRESQTRGGLNPKATLPDEARYDFLRLGEEIATSLVESAEAQVTQAQNMLEHTKAFAENVRAQITEKAKELHDMNEKLRAFGSTILDAHNKFHTNGKAG